VAVGTTVTFDGSGSFDPDGEIQTYVWEIRDVNTDQVITIESADPQIDYAFNEPARYAVSLRVKDDCDAFSEPDVASLEVGLLAGFKIEKLVAVDPITGAETWVPTGTDPNDPIEYGLKVRLNALDYSAGNIILYWWQKNGAGYGSDPIMIKSYTGPTQFQLKLTVYDEGYLHNVSVTKTVYVAQGMHVLSITPYSGTSFNPAYWANLGTELWGVDGGGTIAVVDISDPANLPAVQVMAPTLGTAPASMAASDGKLYISSYQNGVWVCRADRNNFSVLAHLTPQDLGNPAATGDVAAVGEFMYVLTAMPNRVLVYDVSDGFAPVLVDQVALPGGVQTMRLVGSEAVLVQKLNSSTIWALDIRQPDQPQLLPEPIQPPQSYVYTILTYDHTVILPMLSKTAFFELVVPDDTELPLTFGQMRIVDTFSVYSAASATRLYTVANGYLRKFDGLYPATGQPSYQIDQYYPGYQTPVQFICDADGPGDSYQPVLFIGLGPNGWGAWAP